MHRFADFLIAVEAEMNKVSWPSRAELVRSSVVVIMVLFLLAIVLFGLDIVWSFVFEWLGILYKAPSGAGTSP
jgi:preprotein translocase subunit SecE